MKIAVVRYYLEKFGLRRFIETGTFYGAMTDIIARQGIFVDTIELQPFLALRARRIFSARPDVRVHEGDSAVLLPELLASLEEPALFWLDAHWSGGVTARGSIDTPISVEIEAILRHPLPHVVLIDDARQFDGTSGYPRLHELLGGIRRDGRYAVEVSADIVRCVPRRGAAEGVASSAFRPSLER